MRRGRFLRTIAIWFLVASLVTLVAPLLRHGTLPHP